MQLLIEPFVMLMPWWRRDHEDGDVVGELRWFQWGYINRRDGEPRAWYILIRLPSYRFGFPAWEDDYYNGRPSWWQRCLLFKEPMPAGIGSWQFTEYQQLDHE